MFKKTLLASLLLATTAYGQQYPSPTYNNLTVNGTIRTPLVPAPWLPLSGGTISKPTASGTTAYQLNILNPTNSTAPTYISVLNGQTTFDPGQPAAYFGATGTLNGAYNDPTTTANMGILAGGIDGSQIMSTAITGEGGVFFRAGASVDNGGTPVFMAFNATGALGFSGNIGATGWNNIFKTSSASAYGTAGQTIISAGGSLPTAWGVLPPIGGGTGTTSAESIIAYGGGTAKTATVNSAAVTAAQAHGGYITVPVGTFNTNTGSTVFVGPYLGPGQFVDSSGNPRAPELAEIGSAPTWTPSDANSITTWQKGNWSKTFPAWEYWITGAATLGQPVSGYLYTDPATPREGYLYNASGWNNGTADNSGRTGATAYRTHLFQAGQGDAVAYNCTGFASSQRAGATNFLANPAISCLTGDLTAGAAGQYLDADEIIMADGGFDAAAVGLVRNFNRTVTTGALGAYWAGLRIQSKGAGAIDVALSVVGPVNTIVDATTATLGANKSAITLSAGQRIYLNAANVDGNQNPAATTVGGVYIFYDNAASAISLQGTSVVVGAPTGGAKGTGTVNATGLYVNGVSVAAPLSGTTASIGGGALIAGACATATVTITGATTSMVAVLSPATYPGDGFEWASYVSAVNTVTAKVCALIAGTPTASLYNVRVIQ